MLSHQLKIVRKRRRYKTIQWKRRLDWRLRLQEAYNTCAQWQDSTLASFSYLSYFLAIFASAVPEALSQLSSNLGSATVITALLVATIQASCFRGGIQCDHRYYILFMYMTDEVLALANPLASRYEYGWTNPRPLPPQGQPWTVNVLNLAPKTVYLGKTIFLFPLAWTRW
jgi:hypothetical protein